MNYDNAGLTISTRHLRRILHKMKSSRNELSFQIPSLLNYKSKSFPKLYREDNWQTSITIHYFGLIGWHTWRQWCHLCSHWFLLKVTFFSLKLHVQCNPNLTGIMYDSMEGTLWWPLIIKLDRDKVLYV
jgi:hypothetical protein